MKRLRFIAVYSLVLIIFASCQPDIADGDIDLSTTFFPFGLGYEWCYECHSSGQNDLDGWTSWNYYDTFRIAVLDSFWDGDTLLFNLSGNGFRDLKNPVRIWEDQIEVLRHGGGIYPETLSVTNPRSSKKWDGAFEIHRIKDTLKISLSTFTDSDCGEPYSENSARVKGIGIISQGSRWSAYGGSWYSANSYRLLYFYNGNDTVYKSQ